MNKYFILITIVFATIGFSGCRVPYFEVDTQLLQDKIYEPTVVRREALQSTTVLYLDHSTCIIDAVQNSAVFKALRPNLGQYCDTLQLIEEQIFKTISLNRQANRVSEALETIKNDIPFADIRKAVFQICNDNQQAILISDCESFDNGRFLDSEPYMTEPFINWLKKGHIIYIIVEPYKEAYKGNIYDKKRFYFIFSDDRMEAPISVNMMAQLAPLKNSGLFQQFKLTNSDIYVQRVGDMVDPDLTTSNFKESVGFEYISIDNKWDDIREYIMKLDKYGEPVNGGNPVPIIKNLKFNEGENYFIDDVQVVASNITAQYIALSDSSVSPLIVDIPDGFILDKDSLQHHKLNVMLTDKIFNYLTDEFAGNLIRLDFIITKASLKPYESNPFTWQSMFVNGQAICIEKSVENALLDIGVVPTCLNRRVIHTVFLKTESYKQQ